MIRLNLHARCALQQLVGLSPQFQRGTMYDNAFNGIERELRNEEGIANELD